MYCHSEDAHTKSALCTVANDCLHALQEASSSEDRGRQQKTPHLRYDPLSDYNIICDRATTWSLLEREMRMGGERARREVMIGGVELVGRDGSQIKEGSGWRMRKGCQEWDDFSFAVFIWCSLLRRTRQLCWRASQRSAHAQQHEKYFRGADINPKQTPACLTHVVTCTCH